MNDDNMNKIIDRLKTYNLIVICKGNVDLSIIL